jgi:divalent metal cation (Fe/Co/Zn/Cd) transporter
MSRTVAAGRHDLTLAAIRWSVATVAWALLAGGSSVAVGLSIDSTALVGVGLNSLLDGVASTVLVWRFRHERVGIRPSHELERRASQFVGGALVLIAFYVATRAFVSLAEMSGPEPTALGIGLATASLLVLPVLSRAKIQLGRALDSQALRADGILSGAGAGLAATALIGFGLSEAFDWWWSDSLAAITIALVLLREGGLTARTA